MPDAEAGSEGPAVIDTEIAQRVARLSAGQLDCLRLVDQHLSSKEIAAELKISPHTVDQRIRGALHILGVERRTQAEPIDRRPFEPGFPRRRVTEGRIVGLATCGFEGRS